MPRLLINTIDNTANAYECAPGENLYHFMAAQKLIDAPCGGVGCCGKCKVKILAGAVFPKAAEKEYFSLEEMADGWRLACLHAVQGDISLELPPEEVSSEIVSKGYVKAFVKKPNISKNSMKKGIPCYWPTPRLSEWKKAIPASDCLAWLLTLGQPLWWRP